MAIAHQAEVFGLASTAAGNYDTVITPAAAPNGVVVAIQVSASSSDLVTSVAYGTGAGSVPLTRAASPYGFATDATEAGGVYLYWAGDSAVFPSGAQTVRIVRTGTSNMRAMISTMTVTPGQQVQLDGPPGGATGTSASVANPSWSHASLVNDVVAYLGIHSGHNTMTATPATNWTLQGSQDVTATGRGFARRVLATAGALAPGWTVAAASFRGSSIAFKQAAPPPAAVLPILVMAPKLAV